MRNFKEFCEKILDNMYNPSLLDNQQCTGYRKLKYMVENNITPATKQECERYDKQPTRDELISPPDIKYMKFLHPITREFVQENWSTIKNLTT